MQIRIVIFLMEDILLEDILIVETSKLLIRHPSL